MSDKIIERDGISLSMSFGRNGILCISTMLGDNRIKYLYSGYDSEEDCIIDFLDFYKLKLKQSNLFSED